MIMVAVAGADEKGSSKATILRVDEHPVHQTVKARPATRANWTEPERETGVKLVGGETVGSCH
jgi:hypothetical protein